MKTTIPLLVLVICFSIAVEAQTEPSKKPRKNADLSSSNAVLKAGVEYNELMKRLKSGRPYSELVLSGDIAAMDRVLADEYTYTSRDGEISNKRQSLEDYKSMQIKIISADLTEQEARIICKHAAVETGMIRYQGFNKGVRFDITKRYTTTWVYRNGRWQVIADHTSKVEKPQTGNPGN